MVLERPQGGASVRLVGSRTPWPWRLPEAPGPRRGRVGCPQRAVPAKGLRAARGGAANSQLARLRLCLVSEEFVFPDSVQVCFNPPKEELSLINKRRLKMVEKSVFPRSQEKPARTEVEGQK